MVVQQNDMRRGESSLNRLSDEGIGIGEERIINVKSDMVNVQLV